MPGIALDHGVWEPWHPWELARRLKGVSVPWHVVGGWALDLWHGCQTREHEDLEFAVLRDDLHLFQRAFAGMEFYAAHDGTLTPLALDKELPSEMAQVWCRDAGNGCWRVDMMVEPGTPATWVFKRDHTIARPRSEMIGSTAEGIPYLKPAAMLLFKAKHLRAKDEADFERTLPKLTAADRAWLKAALERLHAGHAWIRML